MLPTASFERVEMPPYPPVIPQEPLLRVGDVMSRPPVTRSPRTSVYEAYHLMQQQQIRHLPILHNGQLVGIVSDRDLRLVLPSPATSLAVQEIRYLLDKLTVGEVMTRDVMTTLPGHLIMDAVGRMLQSRLSALPVMDDRIIVGILTRTDVLRTFYRWCAAC